MSGTSGPPPAASPRLRITLFGRLRIESEAGPIHLPAKVASLFAYLILHPEPAAREKLAALLWGDVPDDQARHSLRTALNYLRQALGGELLLTDRDSVRLDPSFPLWVDVWDFERQVKVLAGAPIDVLYIPQLYAGDLLADLYDDWIFPERERYRRQYQDALLQATQRARSQSEFSMAIELAQQVLAQDPANERAHQHLMFCYAASGDRSAALRQYGACCKALHDDLDVTPSSETDALYRWIKETQSQAASQEALVTNLPYPLTRFIGRKQEIAQLEALLAGDRRTQVVGQQPAPNESRSLQGPRLLTLTGAGGSGKTRLAVEVGLRLVQRHRDGVWWVDLAPVAEEGGLARAVARALAVREQPHAAIVETLVDFLRNKELLLLLDNCEHLATACASLAETLLMACPGLVIIATSRATLGVAGERVWHVPTLSTPDPHAAPPISTLREFDAVELFLDRAAAANPGFVLTAVNAPDVIRVCAQLDGIPLAIELAAGRMKLLTVGQIAERLADRLDLLAASGPAALPRHRTLRATIDWSYDLLTEPERVCFQRLSVFAGGWTLEAAEAVCAGDPIQAWDVLDLLTHLVDHSLVTVQQDGPEVRYRLLETLRRYGAERLAMSGKSSEACHRHTLYFAALAERAERGLRSPEMSFWLGRLEADHDNFRAALSWSLDHEPEETSLRFARTMGIFWSKHAYLREGQGWLERLLARGADAPPALRAKAMVPAGWFARVLGDYERAIRLNEEALVVCRQVDDRLGMVDVLNQRGTAALFGSDFTHASACFGESLALAEELGEHWARAIPLLYLAQTAVFNLQWDRHARDFCEEGLGLCEEMHDRSEQAHAHIVLGLGAHFERDDDRARDHFAEAVSLSREAGDHRQLVYSMGLLGLALHWLGRWAEGLPLAREALRIALELGEKTAAANAIQFLAALVKDQGETERAVRLMSYTYSWAESFGFRLAPMMRTINDPEVAAMRANLGEARFADAWAAGAAMSAQQACETALGRRV